MVRQVQRVCDKCHGHQHVLQPASDRGTRHDATHTDRHIIIHHHQLQLETDDVVVSWTHTSVASIRRCSKVVFQSTRKAFTSSHMVLVKLRTVSDSDLKLVCLLSTSAYSALKVLSLHIMRYINLLTVQLLTQDPWFCATINTCQRPTVTFCLYNTPFVDIVAFEKYHDLETWISGHSRSLEMTAVDRS